MGDTEVGGGREGVESVTGCSQPAALGVGSITNGDISEGCENLVEEGIEASWNTDPVSINKSPSRRSSFRCVRGIFWDSDPPVVDGEVAEGINDQ
jgi:hypothetical protein